MTEARTMLSLAGDYLSERRALGFDLRIPGDLINAFARFVDEAGHTGPLTTGIILDWVQGQAKHATSFSWARRLDVLRPFAKYLARLDPATEFPQTAIFGRSHRRLAPHIYSEQEICAPIDKQRTGEDWEGATLALSTTRPSHATAARQPEMLSIDFAEEGGGKPRAPASQVLSKSDFDRGYASRDTTTEQPPASTGGNAFQTVYAIPGRTAIKANGEAKRLQLGVENFDPSLLVLAVPRFDLTAYLYARLKLPKASQPLLAGPAALFRDGVFAGNGELPQLAPGEEHELGFGADERVRVKQAVIDDKKGETGTFTTSRMEERHYAIAVKNLHAWPIQLHVIDRVPVAMHQDIKVDFSMDKGPQPSVTDVNGRRGVMLWAMKTEADEEKQIAFGYRITSPADKPIGYREPSASTDGGFFRFGASTRF